MVIRLDFSNMLKGEKVNHSSKQVLVANCKHGVTLQLCAFHRLNPACSSRGQLFDLLFAKLERCASH